MAAYVARDFATACGVADVDRVLQIEGFDERSQIVGVGVQVIAGPRLAGAAVTAAVMRDAPVSAIGQIEHLIFECIRRKWPAVAEDDGLSVAPVVVINLRAVLRGDCAHGVLSCAVVGGSGRVVRGAATVIAGRLAA